MATTIFNGLKAKASDFTDWKQLEEQTAKNPQAWKAAVEFIGKNLTEFPTGKHELAAGAFVNVQEYVTKDSALWEYHEKYIDIQFMIKGQENIKIAPKESLTGCTQPMNPEKDVALFEGSTTSEDCIISQDSVFAIFFPGEGHCPGLKIGTNEPIKKVIVKIPFIK